MLFGRLAQLVEHPLDVREVTGSSPVSSTTYTVVKCRSSRRLPRFFNFLTSRIFQAWQVRHKYDKKEKDHELGPFLLDGGAQGFHVGMVINFGQHTQVTMSKKFGDHQP